MANEKKREYKTIILLLIIIFLVYVGLSWYNSGISHSLKFRLQGDGYDLQSLRGGVSAGGGGGGGGAETDLADEVVDELRVTLEPMDGECIADSEVCLDACDDEFMDCDDGLEDCYDTCDETYPMTDEIIACQDECFAVGDDCSTACAMEGEGGAMEIAMGEEGGMLIIDDTTDCEDACYAEEESCIDTCDSEYIGCCGTCDETLPDTCLEREVDCYYGCVDECIPEDETVVWSGEEVTNVGEFYNMNFPMFSAQFETICEAMFFGDYISTPNAFICNDYVFFADFFIPMIRSWNSAKDVCEHIGHTWISGMGTTGCVIE